MNSLDLVEMHNNKNGYLSTKTKPSQPTSFIIKQTTLLPTDISLLLPHTLSEAESFSMFEDTLLAAQPRRCERTPTV